MWLEELESRLLLSAHVATTNFVLFRPLLSRPADTAAPTGLTPATIQQAYGMNQVMFGSIVGNGAGQTIAIVDAYNDPNIASDLQKFDAAFGLANPVLTVENQNGSTSSLPRNSGSTGWSVEESLDVEWAHVAAPGAKILLVEANSASNTDLLAAVDTARATAGVSVVSMSWGMSEYSGMQLSDSHFTTPSGHIGVTFVASSGDTGAADVEYPAVSPNVLSVGGTYLTTGAGGSYGSESAWSSGSSGISRYVTQPSYQSGVVSQFSTTKRTVPDVAMDASPSSGVPVYDSYDYGTSAPWAQVGGTSLAAPLWAGVLAVANQGRVLAGEATLNGPTQTMAKLYTLQKDFHDVTTGSNGYPAGSGYDLATGLGTPVVNLLVGDLVGATAPANPVPVIGSLAVSPSSVLTGSGTTVTLTASNVAESSGTATITGVAFYRESNGTSGLQIGSDALLTGTVSKNGTTYTLAGVSTAGLLPGSYTFYAVATDSAHVASAVASTTLTVTAPVPVIGSFTVSPSAVSAGTSVTLTAANVSGSISNVAFYQEYNGIAGLQTTGDYFLGYGTQSGTTWTLSGLGTSGVAPGNYTLYALATDTAGLTSNVASAGLTITAPAGPVNDNFANASVVSGTSLSVAGTNVNATKQAGEPNIAGNLGGKSVWWNWTPLTSGKVTIATEGSNFDTTLGVYTGSSVSSLTLVASSDDVSRYDLTSAVTFTATAGVTYHIAVDGYNYSRTSSGAASGNIVLNLSQVAPLAVPANDNFASAVNLGTSAITWTGSNVGATVQAGEPYHAGNVGGASVWFTWTAATSRVVSINTHGSNFDTTLAVYTGNSVSGLTLVAANDDDPAGGTATSALTFNAVAGMTYRIAIDSYNGGTGPATGSIVLNVV